MAEHKKPAKPKAEKADNPQKPKAEEKSPAAEIKADQAAPAPATETTAHVSVEAKPARKPAKPSKPESTPAEAPRENLTLDADEVEKPKIVKAKGAKNIHSGIAHVYATFNNTIVTITDLNGNVIGWSSAGKVGFKGSRKSTAYAAQLVAQDASRQAMGHGLKEVQVLVKGPGAGRESAVRALQAIGLDSRRDTGPA